MLFEQVIGQQKLKEKLITSVNTGKISHALLLLGNIGHGGLPIALALSQYINCENKGDTDSCGTCPSCRKAEKMIHPDIHYSHPIIVDTKKKKEKSSDYITEWREAVIENPYLNLHDLLLKLNAENKQANIPIKECHDIIKKLSLKTFEAPYKTLILYLPEYLGKEGNALLKILEEPPEKTLFILVAEHQDSILNTIISRTQIINIPNIAPDILTTHLVNNYDIGELEAKKLANISHGNLTTAISMLNHSVDELAEYFSNWLQLCLPSNGGHSKSIEIYQWVEKFKTIGRENQKGFFLYGLHFLNELNTVYFTEKTELLTNAEQSLAKKIMEFISFEKMCELYELFNGAHYHLGRNANPKILLMNLSIKIALLMKKKNVAVSK